MKAAFEFGKEQIMILMEAMNRLPVTEQNDQWISIMGDLEDRHCELQCQEFGVEEKKIKAACPWATDEAIAEYVMEFFFEDGFGIDGFKKSVLG